MDNYWEQKFWDLYDRDYETGMALENIMDKLDVEPIVDPNDNGSFKLPSDQYQEVVKAFYANDNHPYSDNEILFKMEELLSEEFDVMTFEEAGLLTMNKGLVIRKGGKEYQFALLGSNR